MNFTNLNSGDFVGIVLVGAIALGLQLIIVRWMWKVNIQTKQQRVILELLAKLCEKNGVTKDEIESLKFGHDIK